MAIKYENECMLDEIDKIKERYDKRKEDSSVHKKYQDSHYTRSVAAERESKFAQILDRKFDNPKQIKMLEIGAGSGSNLHFFKKYGLEWENIHANELLQGRFEVLIENFPEVKAYEGDALRIDEEKVGKFDVIFQSTVFTSILDTAFKQKMADKMWGLLQPNGIVLWYDFTFDNPRNKDVKGIKRAEIEMLFPKAKNITFYKTTLAPPIGRRVKKGYSFFNLFPFLRTHVVAVIEKQ